MGEERRLRIVFPSNFPQRQLELLVEPSPWLVWPHAMENGLCLHGFREKPITGSPETMVEDSFSRLGRIIDLSRAGSDDARRDAEFQREITTYWSRQSGQSLRNIVLLERPKDASRLFALSDPRNALPSGQETVWLAADESRIKRYFERVVGRASRLRALECPAFYVKLQTYPDIRVPEAESLMAWLMEHLTDGDAASFALWFNEKGSLVDRWVVIELPGVEGVSNYCFNVHARGIQPNRGTKFGLRSSRRNPAKVAFNVPALIRSSTLNILDRAAILSRDLSGTAQRLESSRVVFVGVGSLGSAVALQLARSGVGCMTFIDPDILVSENLGRHTLGADDLGKSKAVALKEKIIRDLPTVEVTAYKHFSEMIMLLRPEIFNNADLVIVTTADWESEVALWKAKVDGAPWGILQAWSEPHTQVGHALIAPAGKYDARYLFSDNGDFYHKYTEWPDGGAISLPACGESFIPGGSLGMANVASMVSQAALSALTGQLQDTSWFTSIYRPQDVATLGGKYCGPQLPDGVQQTVLERRWPEQREKVT